MMRRRKPTPPPAFPATCAHGGKAVWENSLPLGDPPPPEIELIPAGPPLNRVECENRLDEPRPASRRRKRPPAAG